MHPSRFGSKRYPDFSQSRRRFVRGVAGSALAFVGARQAGWGITAAEAFSSGADSPSGDPNKPQSAFQLEVGSREVSFTGRVRSATVVNGQLPAPLLSWREGDTVTIRVSNRLAVPTSIHWHGLLLPADMDGVPGISFAGIPPGSTYVYRFQLKQSGTYWYHSHSRFQEQVGLYGPIVIQPRAAVRHAADREHVILLSDWSDEDPERIYRTLKVQSDYFNYGKRTLPELLEDAHRNGLSRTVDERRMWGRMRMRDTDLLDVSGHAYTYLMNGVTPAANWTGLFRRGERVRLRIINGSSMSLFDFRIPGLEMKVVAADGQDVEPVTVDEFRIGAAEVYDVIVEPKTDRAYTLFAQAMDRSGYARGTLAPAAGIEAEVPALDPRPVLTMIDMGMGHTSGAAAARDFGPNVDSVALQPTNRLNDPGVGLRNNGRRALTYADLHTLGGSIDTRKPSREIQLHLTGHMERFVWSFNGEKFSASQPLRFKYGERLRIVLVNDSMMTHPIHLHGMWSELEAEDGAFLVRKHTVLVQPAQKLSFGVSANALGRWAFHCHLLYHMEAGMFREVAVESTGPDGARS